MPRRQKSLIIINVDITENRQSTRYTELGRVFSTELCALPGILDDISIDGCKLHFPVPVVVDLDNEYKVKIQLSRSADEEPLQLLCKPIWVNETGGTTYIGFQILYSPDDLRLRQQISVLERIYKKDIPEII